MKRLLFISSIAFLFINSCENLNTNLPETDTSIYISGNEVTFPRGTKAIDIYNTVSTIFNDYEYHDITNGEWQYIYTVVDTDGLISQTWQSVSFFKIKYTYSTYESDVNTHKVYFYASDTNIKLLVFEWQRQTTNVWKNDVIDGEIKFTF